MEVNIEDPYINVAVFYFFDQDLLLHFSTYSNFDVLF